MASQILLRLEELRKQSLSCCFSKALFPGRDFQLTALQVSRNWWGSKPLHRVILSNLWCKAIRVDPRKEEMHLRFWEGERYPYVYTHTNECVNAGLVSPHPGGLKTQNRTRWFSVELVRAIGLSCFSTLTARTGRAAAALLWKGCLLRAVSYTPVIKKQRAVHRSKYSRW